jgi:hypothetical protein
MKIRLLILSVFSLNFVQAQSLTTFTDSAQVPVWAQASFNGLLEAGVIKGNNKKQIKPLDTINRAEFTKILLEATGKKLINPSQSNFKDVQPNQWFYTYVETAADLGWVTGYNNGDFKPGNPINRAEIAKLINKAFDLKPVVQPTDKTWYDAEVRTLSANKILPYNVSKSAFGASKNPSRSEAFDQIFRAMNLKPLSPATTTLAPPNTSTTAIIPKGTETVFEAPTTFKPINTPSSAGTLNVSGLKNLSTSLNQGQSNALLGTYIFKAQNSASNLNGIQFRRIGNGDISSYESLWLEVDGQKVTSTIKPNDDLVTLNLNNLITLSSGQIWRANLKGNLSPNAQSGSSERFVLYLPSWVNANTTNIVGLFPIAGNNIDIR